MYSENECEDDRFAKTIGWIRMGSRIRGLGGSGRVYIVQIVDTERKTLGFGSHIWSPNFVSFFNSTVCGLYSEV